MVLVAEQVVRRHHKPMGPLASRLCAEHLVRMGERAVDVARSQLVLGALEQELEMSLGVEVTQRQRPVRVGLVGEHVAAHQPQRVASKLA